MTIADLTAQRAEVAQAEQDHLLAAAEARGAMRLIDFWLGRLRAAGQESAAKEQAGADSRAE